MSVALTAFFLLFSSSFFSFSFLFFFFHYVFYVKLKARSFVFLCHFGCVNLFLNSRMNGVRGREGVSWCFEPRRKPESIMALVHKPI